MIPFVFVRLSVFKDEASTQGFLASPLGQGERTKVRGLGAGMRDFPWRETLTLPLSLQRRGDHIPRPSPPYSTTRRDD